MMPLGVGGNLYYCYLRLLFMIFEGYLMTEYHSHKRATFECVDESPEYITGHGANRNGALFYFVKPDCDGDGDIGHCPPYYSDRQLTCVVCSR